MTRVAQRKSLLSVVSPLMLAVLALAAVFTTGCPKDEVEEEQPFVEPVPGKLEAAAAVRLLEMPVGHSHAGYTQTEALASPHPPDDPGSPFAHLFPASRGVETPATARVVVLDNGHDRIVLARLDLIYITAELTTRVLAEVRERFGYDIAGDLLLSSTHTHATGHRMSRESVDPDLFLVEDLPPEGRHALAHGGDTYSEESMDRVAGPTAEAIGEALESLRPARIGWGTAENHTAARNRRCQNDWLYGPGYMDPTVSVLRVDDAESGAPIAVAFHYSAHGTMNGESNRSLSVDGIGHAEFKVEEAFDEPVVAVFLQGPAGDIRPVGGDRGHRGTQAMERFGWNLARSVMEAHGGIETRDTVVLQSMQRWVPISYDLLGYDWEAVEFFNDGAILCNYMRLGCDVEDTIDPQDVRCLAPVLPDAGKYETLLAAARIDDLYLQTMPGEAVTEVGRLLREAARDRGAEHSLTLGFAMDHNGYILTDDDWLSGGYESTITFWGWRFGPFIIEQGVDLLDEMLTGEPEQLLPVEEPLWEPIEYEPVEPTISADVPAIDYDLPAEIERLSEVVLSFWGGDPALGTPEVLLERLGDDGEFEPVLVAGWRPFSNLRAHGLPLRYEPAPTYIEEPDARERSHRFEVVWEPMQDTPEGVYRLAVSGHWRDEDGILEYSLHSKEMTLLPRTDLDVAWRRLEDGGDALALLVTYPAEAPRYSDLEGSSRWQVGRFRMIDPFFGHSFVPLWRDGVVNGDIIVTTAGGDEIPVTPSFRGAEEPPESTAYEPGDGPGFVVELPGEGPWQVVLPAGAFGDAHGNLSRGPLTIELDGP